MVRTLAELRAALSTVPYLDDEPESSKLMIVFLSDRPPADAAASLDRERFAPDRFEVIGREMFVHYRTVLGDRSSRPTTSSGASGWPARRAT